MSKRQRAAHRAKIAHRQAHGHRDTWSGRPATDSCYVIGWCLTTSDLPECRKITHDKLIAMMGDQRDGPVSWHTFERADADTILDELENNDTNSTRRLANTHDEFVENAVKPIRALLHTEGGHLVVASAPGRHRQ